MRILLVNKFNYPKGGSDEMFLKTKELLEKEGHQVAVFAMDHPKNLPSKYSRYFVSYIDSTNPNLYQGFKLFLRSIYSFEATKKIKKLINEFNPEVAHLHNIYHQISPSIIPVLRKRKIPIILTAHDYKLICPSYHINQRGIICPKNKFSHAWHCIWYRQHQNSYLKSLAVSVEWLIHQIFRIYKKNINKVLVPSNYVYQQFVNHGWPLNKLEIVSNFIDVSQKQQREPGEYVLYVGRLSPEKGLRILEETAKKLPDIPFVIVGEGDIKNISKLNNVKTIGFVEKSELFNYYQNARLVFIPSIAQESFSLVAAEASVLGIPLVASKVGAIPEIVKNDINGLLFNPYSEKAVEEAVEGILKVWYHPEKYKGKGEDKFTPIKYSQQLIQVYLESLNQKRL